MNIIYYDTQREWDRFVPGALRWTRDTVLGENDFFIVHDSERRTAQWEFRETHRNVYCLVIDGGGPAQVAGVNEGGYFHCCRVAVSRGLQGKSRLVERLRSVIDYCRNNPGSNAPWHFLYEDTVDRIRQRLLTPFVLLHLGLQMEKEKKRSFVNEPTDEEKECLRGGEDLLSDQKKMEQDLCELMGVPHQGKGDGPEPLKQLRQWVDDNNSELGQLFEQAVSGKKFKRLAEQKLNGTLSTIEELSEIVDRAVDYGERVKKNSSMRHFLKNAVPRLTNYFAGLNKEMRSVLDLEMKDLESSFRTFLAPSAGYDLDAKTRKTSDAAYKAVTVFRDKLDKKGNDQNLVKEIKKLVNQLETIEKLTFNSPEAKLS